MQGELLFYRLGEVPAKKKQGFFAVAIGMQEAPGFMLCGIQVAYLSG